MVWRRAVDLIKVVSDITMRFPEHEKYEIGRQMRRAVASISFNIAEGSGKRTSKDYISFLHIALGSVNEVETQVESVDRLGYLKVGERGKLLKELIEIKKMVNGVIRFVEKKDVR